MSGELTRQCESLREHLPEYAEGRLEGRVRAQVEGHVSGCARCAAEVEDLRAVIGAVRAVGLEETPEDLVRRVRRAVQERAPAPAGRGLLWARFAVPAAVLTALVAVTFAIRAPKQQSLVPAAGMMERAEGPLAAAGEAEGARGSAGIEIAQKSEAMDGPASGAPRPSAERPASPMVQADGDSSASSFSLAASPAPTAPEVQETRDRLSAADEAAGLEFHGAAGAAPRMGKEQPKERIERLPTRQAGGTAGGRGGGGSRGGGPGAAEAPALEWKSLGMAGSAETLGSPSLSAKATLVSGAGGKLIALQLAADQPIAGITLRLGERSPQEYAWRGPEGSPAYVPLTEDVVGPGPAAIPVRLTAAGLSREYVLFVPTMARLGESAPAAPRGGYGEQSLEAVLSEFAALTGLVVLAERPLDVTMTGEMPQGKPGEALEQLAAEAGFEADREGDIVYTLTRRR